MGKKKSALVLIAFSSFFIFATNASAAVPRNYVIHSAARPVGTSRTEIRNRYLVPVGFNWNDNGIPSNAVTFLAPNNFRFNASKVIDTGIGGYGTGGYYWRKFKTFQDGQWLHYWLSAWNKDHLIYG